MQQKPKTAEWLELEPNTRKRLIDAFKIDRSVGVTVVNNKVVCDGVTDRDLEAMNIGKMIEYLGEDLEWYDPNLCNKLFNLSIDKAYGKEVRKEGEPSVGIGRAGDEQPASQEVVGKRKGRPRKGTQNLPVVA